MFIRQFGSQLVWNKQHRHVYDNGSISSHTIFVIESGLPTGSPPENPLNKTQTQPPYESAIYAWCVFAVNRKMSELTPANYNELVITSPSKGFGA